MACLLHCLKQCWLNDARYVLFPTLCIVWVPALVLIFTRSRAKSASSQEPISMETNTNAVRMQPNIYAGSREFDGPQTEGNTNSGYYTEIPDLAVDDQVDSRPGKVSETNSARGTKYTGNYEEIDDIHRDPPKVGNYEEIPDIMTNLPSGKNDVTDGSLQEGNHDTTKPEDIAHNLYDNNKGEEPQNRDSLFDKTRSKPISIVKSGDEIVVMDNDIYTGGTVENDDIDKDIWGGQYLW